MPNLLNRKFQFGFLNNNQDPVDLAPNEATLAESLDADRLALGTLESSSYIDPASTGKDWTGVTTPVILNGRKFRLNSGILQFEENTGLGGGSWRNVNDGASPPKGDTPTVSLVDTLAFNPPNPIPTETFPTPGSPSPIVIYLGVAAGLSYTGQTGVIIQIRAYGDAVADPPQFQWKLSTDTIWRQTLTVSEDPNTPTTLNYGNLTVYFDNIPTDYTTTPFNVLGESQISSSPLVDGQYNYVQVNVANDSTIPVLNPNEDIQSIPSDPSIIVLDNFDESGIRISASTPLVTFPSLASYVSEIWLYRKGPDDTEYVRVARYDGTDIITDTGVTIAGTNEFSDAYQITSIVSLKLLVTKDDETFTDINAAVGNSSGTFAKLFEKNGRLWLVPTDRQDLLLYSRSGDWWGWNRSNSFSYEGTINDLVIIRDPTTVGGEFTTVIGTTDGLYHITGSGTSQSPFLSIKAVQEVNVMANSMIDANGVVILSTRSADFGYDTGPYGQKVYEYNLQNMVEVSQRVKNSPALGVGTIEYAELRGSDKYLLKAQGVSQAIMYHRDAQNWVTVTQAVEDLGLWNWSSKKFTPQMMQRFKIDYARMIKVDYVGDMRIRFEVSGPDDSSVTPVTIDLPVKASRGEYIQRLPNLLGRKWLFAIEAQASGAVLYDFYFVR